MPASKRTVSRPSTSASSAERTAKSQRNGEGNLNPSTYDKCHDGADDGGRDSPEIPTVKHAPVPTLPTEGIFLIETLIFVFSIFALGLQYIHIYKTVWWLPYSHSNYALNFYLIDPHLAIFIVVLLSRRVMYTFYKGLCFSRTRSGCLHWFSVLCRLTLACCFALALFSTGYQVIKRQGFTYILILIYPILMYFFLFRLKIRPFFGKTVMIYKPPTEKGAVNNNKNKETRVDSLQHACSSSPDVIRQEVEILKNDFNKRLKQVLFNSFFCAYYAGFVPLCFTQNTVYYNVLWVWQHVALVWSTVFLLYFLHFLSSKYIDVLHSSSLHLGKWTKVEGRLTQGSTAWSELHMWPQSALVKHVRGHFRADGVINTAEPGNKMHCRFHFLFYHPLRVSHGLLALSSTLVLYQLISLLLAGDWSQIISLTFLLFTSYYILFKVMRDTLTLRKAYKSEEVLS